jgi:hypothetical protein
MVEDEESTDGRLIGGKELLLWRFGLLKRCLKSSDKQLLDSRQKLLKSDKAGGTGGGSAQSGAAMP